MSIRQLPDHVVDNLKSSATVTSLNGVVCGLIANSLDAGAARINVRLDFARGDCVVEDDGSGIEPCEFLQDGGLGKLHHTSKDPASSTVHGRRGDFIAAVATLSLLSVVSHHHRHVSQAALAIHNSKVLTRHVPAPLEQRVDAFDHGTRVSVRSLFGSMPVRVKHRASVFSERSAVDKEWGHLVREVAALLLAWPTEVSVSLHELPASRQVRLKSSSIADLIPRVSRLFIQASLADSGDASSWIPVSASSRHVRIKGCVSTTPVATRRAQIMSLGVRPILDNHDSNVLFDAANKVFGNSSFGIVEDAEGRESSAKPRKGLERWPMFYFQINLLGLEVEVNELANNPRNGLSDIADLLQTLCYEFLKKHHFRPLSIEKSSDRTAFSTAKVPKRSGKASTRSPAPSQESHSLRVPRSESPFDDWNRGKVGKPTLPDRRAKTAPDRRDSSSFTALEQPRRFIGEGGRLIRRPFDDPPVNKAEAAESGPHTSKAPSTVTNLQSTIDPGHGPKRLRVLESRPKPAPSPWLKYILDSWKNPVFEPVEKPVPRISGDDTHYGASGLHQCRGDGMDVNFEAGSINLAGRLSRSTMADAEFVAQVDRKFILIKLALAPTTQVSDERHSQALVMVDQHAADERCRLEDLMAGYFVNSGAGVVQPVVESLDRSINFETAGREGELIQRHQGHFGAWGVQMAVESGPGTAKVVVLGLPPSILERCRSEPRLVIDLIRKEAWALDDGTAVPPRSLSRDAGKPWSSWFRGCPSGILELLYSRSCRSAIMFNDELSADECRALVRRLSRCAFPFQCAHGRPSMVPLADVGSGPSGRIGGWHADGTAAIGAERWKRWMVGTGAGAGGGGGGPGTGDGDGTGRGRRL
ncbi:MLH3 protein [Purpureocillium lavendulum]|uniref:MLH3 protein n=1 Tax=Purpureocillium lavendulum TaxID=1247861 RepID=A0AB34FJW3_9HYPO|nr:MLH3 protein [Purpureocillium lavendulum]